VVCKADTTPHAASDESGYPRTAEGGQEGGTWYCPTTAVPGSTRRGAPTPGAAFSALALGRQSPLLTT
jgi:hypothetical protein